MERCGEASRTKGAQAHFSGILGQKPLMHVTSAHTSCAWGFFPSTYAYELFNFFFNFCLTQSFSWVKSLEWAIPSEILRSRFWSFSLCIVVLILWERLIGTLPIKTDLSLCFNIKKFSKSSLILLLCYKEHFFECSFLLSEPYGF